MELTREQKRAWLEKQIATDTDMVTSWETVKRRGSDWAHQEHCSRLAAQYTYHVAILHAELARVNGEPQ